MKLIRLSSILVPVIALAVATACGKKNDTNLNNAVNSLGNNSNFGSSSSSCMSLNQGQIGFTAPNATLGMYAVYADTVSLGGGYRGNNVSQYGRWGQISLNINRNQQYGGGNNYSGGNNYYGGGSNNYYGGNNYYTGPQGVSGTLVLSDYVIGDIIRIASSYSYSNNYYQNFQNPNNNGYTGNNSYYGGNNYLNAACITNIGFNLSVGAGGVYGQAWLTVGVRGSDGQVSTSFNYPLYYPASYY